MAKSHLKSALQSTKTQHKYTQHVARDPEAALNIVLHYSPHHPKECTRQNPSQTQSTNPRPRNALDKADTPALTRGPRFTTKPVTPEYIAQLAAGIQLIFTDYAHQEKSRASWLKERYREIDGEQNCS